MPAKLARFQKILKYFGSSVIIAMIGTITNVSELAMILQHRIKFGFVKFVIRKYLRDI